MPFTIHFTGLVCFERIEGNRAYRVLLPDGRTANPPHIARIVPLAGQAQGVGWTPDSDGNFVIANPTTIGIAPAEQAGALVNGDFERELPNLRTLANGHFSIASNPDTIARSTIRQGTLVPHRHPHGSAFVTQLIVDHTGPFTVTSSQGSIEFIAGAEFGIANISSQPDDGTNNAPHFQLYARLGDPPNRRFRLPIISQTVTESPVIHPVHQLSLRLRAADGVIVGLSSGCSNSGCC